jgi:hypothetical protein
LKEESEEEQPKQQPKMPPVSLELGWIVATELQLMLCEYRKPLQMRTMQARSMVCCFVSFHYRLFNDSRY